PRGGGRRRRCRRSLTRCPARSGRGRLPAPCPAGNTGGMGETTKAAPGAKTLLLTRPAAQSRAFLDLLERRAGSPLPHVISPLFETRPTGARIPAAGTLVLTSGRAVEALAPGALQGRFVYCVGPRTAALARDAGAEAVDGGGDLERLAARLVADRPGRLVHLRGTHVAGD